MSRPRFFSCVACGAPLNKGKENTDRYRVHCSDKCRFYEKVDKESGAGPLGDCWLWTKTRHGKGYGHFTFKGAPAKAHRVSFELATGHEPGDLLVIHLCDNRLCVNPDHLALATNAANMFDRNNKGRQAKGEKSGQAVLTEEMVRDLRSSPLSGRKIATDLGVSAATVFSAKRGSTWKHVK